MHGLDEAVAFDGHDQVDGVEVTLAAEAEGEVGVGVDGGVEVMAQRAEEAEASIMGFVEQFEDLGDQRDDLDAVAQFAQVVLGEGVEPRGLLATAGAVRRRPRRRGPPGCV